MDPIQPPEDDSAPGLPWERAAELFGEPTLHKEAPTYHELERWQTDGVPWDVAGPLAMNALMDGEPPGPRYLTLVRVINEGQTVQREHDPSADPLEET